MHWAEPSFLEVVEHVARRAQGPILVVCLARDEGPAPFDGDDAERIVLDTLSTEDTDALLTGLGGEVLESDQRSRIVGAAGGNPFFLEQLLALALEGGLTERALPPTVQALLAARLDRLGPGERAVLERAAVIATGFSAQDVISLLEPDAAATAEAHLRALADRGFVRPQEGGVFGFRHLLVQEAVYRAAPKRLRAELHERHADRLDEVHADLPELDELAGYHLEQAHALRTELGEADRRTQRLAEDGGNRLGAAGIRAWKRNDVHATVSLLRRATTLLPTGDRRRRELLCELGPALRASGDPTGATRCARGRNRRVHGGRGPAARASRADRARVRPAAAGGRCHGRDAAGDGGGGRPTVRGRPRSPFARPDAPHRRVRRRGSPRAHI